MGRLSLGVWGEEHPNLTSSASLPHPPTPQASAYLKQNKYEQAEELYREILSREDLPAPLGAPRTGITGDTEQQVRRGCGVPGREVGTGD